jgi:multicomponent Na+:H+ antiporter subunit D
MFMAAGLVYAELGHDRIAGPAGIGRVLPLSVLAFALAGLALIGFPASGAYLAKDLLLGAASETGQWWWAIAIQAGGALTAGYVLLVIVHALAPASGCSGSRKRVSRYQESAALVLALFSLVLGLIPWANYLPLPPDTSLNPLTLNALLGSVSTIPGGAVLAISLGRWNPRRNHLPFTRDLLAAFRPVRRAGLVLSRITAGFDAGLRRWSVAGVCLLALLIAFGIALEVAR